jgi:hypothetical protein
VIGKSGENPPPLMFPFPSFEFGFFGTRSVRITNFAILLSFYAKYRMSTSDDEVNLRKGNEVVVIDGKAYTVLRAMWLV